jgi:hypothetical protein
MMEVWQALPDLQVQYPNCAGKIYPAKVTVETFPAMGPDRVGRPAERFAVEFGSTRV